MRLLALSPALPLSALAQTGDAAADPALAAAVAGSHRTPAFAARDGWRHPQQTLAFFGLQPQMTVVELSPGGGWYTEILAPFLREQGQLILAADDPDSSWAYYRRSAERLRQKLQAQPALYDRVRLALFEPPRLVELAAPGTADLVLTFRNLHNWAALGEPVVDAVMRSVQRCLKPGGVFGVVDHRLPAAAVQDAKVSSGYVHVAYAQRLAEAAGLRLAAASEVYANPLDTADHEGGVWALPPSFANKDRDRARYAAIGESDRFTLKFVKA